MKKILLFTLVPFFANAEGIDKKIDQAFKPISDFFSNVIFFTINDIPFVLMLLVFSALFFTIYFAFPNIKYFTIAVNTVRGKYDDLEQKDKQSDDIKETIKDESKDGEVSHFQALATAVSGTVGNGNIAGVALAIALGGPGATFWMIICGLLGMSTKFVECTLGVKYRDVDEDGTVYGNAAQSNQATIVLKDLMGLESTAAGAIIGIIIAVIVGVIIIGGIKRIANVTEKVVPFMALMYLIACLYIIVINFALVDDAISLIISEAFNPTAVGVGSVIGVLLVGFKRAAFSNEAGAGSASIAHSAVKTKYSASEGLVALLEPFIDTVVICTMTALVIIIFNFGGFFEYGGDGGMVYIDGVGYEGAGITSKAFAKYIPFSNVFLTIAVVLFAVSTMISWSYYGLQSWKFIFGRGYYADLTYKILFLIFIVVGAASSMSSIWAFSDAMIFAMIFPNMVGLFFLFPVVKRELAKYLDAIKNK